MWSFQIRGALCRDARDGRRSGRDGLHQVHGDAARRAAQEAPGALLSGAGVRAGAALQTAEVPVGPGERAPGRTDPPHPEPGQNLVPEPSLQTEAAGQGQKRAAAPPGRKRRRRGRTSVCGDKPLLLRVASPEEGLQRAPSDGKQTEQRRGRAERTSAAAGKHAVVGRGAGGSVPQLAARPARTGQHDADGRGADWVHKRHD